MKLYHISNTPNIQILQPQKSTHGIPYVYATPNLELGLLFGSSKSYGDFDGCYGTQDGIPFFYEAYPDAFKRRFENEVCYIYEVEPKTFESGKTSFNAEVVSSEPVKVLNCKKVDNLYSYLQSLIKGGKILYKPYCGDCSEYVEMINEHIKDRLTTYNILYNKKSRTYKFCSEKFPSIISELENNRSKVLKQKLPFQP